MILANLFGQTAKSSNVTWLSRLPGSHWVIWGISMLFTVFQFFLQLSSGVLVDELIKSFSITALGAGILTSMYYYVYTLLQTPAGMLMDRYGPRLLLSYGAFVCGIGCLLFGTALSFWVALLGRLLIGGGSAFAFVGSIYVIREWFEPRKFSFMIGLSETVAMIGTLIGSLYLAKLVTTVGWRSGMVGAGVIASIISLLSWFFIQDNPARISQKPMHTHSFSQRLHTTLHDPLAWLNGLYNSLMFSIFGVFVALWGIPFIMKETHTSLLIATGVSNMVFLGVAIGAPILGRIAETTGRRRLLLVTTTLLASLVMSLIIYIPNLSITYMSILLFFLGVCGAAYILGYAIAEDIAPAHAKNTYIGFTNALCVASAPLMQPLVGYILHKLAMGHTVSGQELYLISDYRIALSLMPLALLVAAGIACFLPDSHEIKLDPSPLPTRLEIA